MKEVLDGSFYSIDGNTVKIVNKIVELLKELDKHTTVEIIENGLIQIDGINDFTWSLINRINELSAIFPMLESILTVLELSGNVDDLEYTFRLVNKFSLIRKLILNT